MPATPDNAGLVIEEEGRPGLKKHRTARPAEAAVALEAALRERMPERTLLGILARTVHWLEWHRRFAPASGSDPKLDDPLFRCVLTTLLLGHQHGPGPDRTARHITAVTAHELSVTARRHVTVGKPNKAIADVVNAFTGSTGGIGYYYISDTYIALFSKFIPVGVSEAVYLIQGLLEQQSKVTPSKVHTDT